MNQLAARLAFLVAGLLVLSGQARAEPVALIDGELDRITAGSEHPAPNGGAIIGNGGSAVLESTGEVSIDDGAQADVAALNLVNSSESTVANGVNVFDGRIDQDGELSAVTTNLEQANVISQDQRRLSALPSYGRGANTLTTSTDAGSSNSDTTSVLYDQVIDLERTTVTDSATTQGSYDRSGAPTLRIQAELDDIASYEAEFNAPSASNSVGVVFNGEIDIGIDSGSLEATLSRTSEEDGTTSGLDLGLVMDLPTLDIEFDAMGCVALNGNCTIDGSRTESTDEISDHSTLSTSDESTSESATWARSESEVVNAAFELQDAQAEYIVVDESELSVNAGYLVHIAGGAQSGLRAMNVVNAAGSAVANGVNVSTQRTGGNLTAGGPALTINQTNTIIHSR